MKTYKPEGWILNTSENKNALSSLSAIKESFRTGKAVEARAVLCDREHNLHVDLGLMKGVIPREEGAIGISEGTVRDIAIISRVNKPVIFVITGFENDELGRTYAVLSRRLVQERCMEEIKTLQPGDVIDAKVTHMESFGAFVDIGAGISALLPVDSISVSRIPHPSQRFSPGDDIKAVVKSIDENYRITLSHKELLGTWEQNASLFSPGETVPGIVRSVEKYGVFVELAPNLAGLAEYSADIEPGQCAGVYIKSMIPEKMKIKLIIVDAFDGEMPKRETPYFTTAEHIDRWVYSPECCPKVVETVFDGEGEEVNEDYEPSEAGTE